MKSEPSGTYIRTHLLGLYQTAKELFQGVYNFISYVRVTKQKDLQFETNS